MASDAYQDHGLIVLWWDESEGGDEGPPAPGASVRARAGAPARAANRVWAPGHPPRPAIVGAGATLYGRHRRPRSRRGKGP
jgi:hypothetical protein